jgi:hypothetical protein
MEDRRGEVDDCFVLARLADLLLPTVDEQDVKSFLIFTATDPLSPAEASVIMEIVANYTSGEHPIHSYARVSADDVPAFLREGLLVSNAYLYVLTTSSCGGPPRAILRAGVMPRARGITRLQPPAMDGDTVAAAWSDQSRLMGVRIINNDHVAWDEAYTRDCERVTSIAVGGPVAASLLAAVFERHGSNLRTVTCTCPATIGACADALAQHCPYVDRLVLEPTGSLTTGQTARLLAGLRALQHVTIDASRHLVRWLSHLNDCPLASLTVVNEPAADGGRQPTDGHYIRCILRARLPASCARLCIPPAAEQGVWTDILHAAWLRQARLQLIGPDERRVQTVGTPRGIASFVLMCAARNQRCAAADVRCAALPVELWMLIVEFMRKRTRRT